MADRLGRLDELVTGMFRERLHEEMEAAGLSAEALANEAGVSKSLIYKYLRDKHEPNPTLTVVARLATALDLSLERLTGTLPTPDQLDGLLHDEKPFAAKGSKLHPDLTKAKKLLLRSRKDCAVIELPVLSDEVVVADVDRMVETLLMLPSGKGGSRGIYRVTQVQSGSDFWETRWEVEGIAGLPRVYWHVLIRRTITPPSAGNRPRVVVRYQLKDPDSPEFTHPMLTLNSGVWEFEPGQDSIYRIKFSSIVGLSKPNVGALRLWGTRLVLPMITRLVFGRYCSVLRRLQRELEIDDLISEFGARLKRR